MGVKPPRSTPTQVARTEVPTRTLRRDRSPHTVRGPESRSSPFPYPGFPRNTLSGSYSPPRRPFPSACRTFGPWYLWWDDGVPVYRSLVPVAPLGSDSPSTSTTGSS